MVLTPLLARPGLAPRIRRATGGFALAFRGPAGAVPAAAAVLAAAVPAAACLALAVLAAAGLAAPLAAQERGDPARFFLAVGPSAGGGGEDTGGMGLVAQLAWQNGPHHVALRSVGMVSPFDVSSEPVGDLGILYGRTRSNRWGHATMAAGVAWTDAGTCDVDGGCDLSTVGVPLVLEAAVEPADVFGLGLQLFGNINPEAFFGGLALYIQLGWMP